MTSWHSYPKVWSIGHGAVSELFYDDVIVQEKVDGSQFSFGIFNGELKIKSKGKELLVDAPEAMFKTAVETVKSLQYQLIDGYTYRGEVLNKPKHNVLAYSRVPRGNIILFDINVSEETYLEYEGVKNMATKLGLEVVPLLFKGKVSSSVDLEKLLDTESVLGGQKIEGFVVKNYSRYGRDKKALMGKFVCESFKESHKKEWKVSNPGQNDIISLLIGRYKTQARWDKAIQHLRDDGQLENSPKDIGKIVKEVPNDLIAECKEEIKEALFLWAENDIVRGVNRGLAEYYKELLFKSQEFPKEQE